MSHRFPARPRTASRRARSRAISRAQPANWVIAEKSSPGAAGPAARQARRLREMWPEAVAGSFEAPGPAAAAVGSQAALAAPAVAGLVPAVFERVVFPSDSPVGALRPARPTTRNPGARTREDRRIQQRRRSPTSLDSPIFTNLRHGFRRGLRMGRNEVGNSALSDGIVSFVAFP